MVAHECRIYRWTCHQLCARIIVQLAIVHSAARLYICHRLPSAFPVSMNQHGVSDPVRASKDGRTHTKQQFIEHYRERDDADWNAAEVQSGGTSEPTIATVAGSGVPAGYTADGARPPEDPADSDEEDERKMMVFDGVWSGGIVEGAWSGGIIESDHLHFLLRRHEMSTRQAPER